MVGANSRLVAILDASTDYLVCSLAQITSEANSVRDRVSMLAVSDHACRRRANIELVPTLVALSKRTTYSLSALDAVIVGRGPGSFTGVRIGIATAKGLACGLNCPLFGASTLDAVAWHGWCCGVRGRVGVVGDAMRGEVYPALYDIDDTGIHRLFDVETVVKADVCVAAWAARSDACDIQLTGDGLHKYRGSFESAGMKHVLDQALWTPTAEGLALVVTAPEYKSLRETGDPALVLPVYTRLSDAEEHEAQVSGLKTGRPVALSGCDEVHADRHMQMRPMRVYDCRAVAELERSIFSSTAHTAWSEAQLIDDCRQANHSWWVMHDEGEIIGFAGMRLAGSDAEVLDVAVSPGRRRQGIARKLLARVTYDAQMLGAHTASLEVEEDNTNALALYASLGFSEVARRPRYYGACDACVLRAQLPLVVPKDFGTPDPHASLNNVWPQPRPARSNDAQKRIADAELILAIESSCDETAMAIITKTGKIVASTVATQIDFHARFGGVVPEIASRKHTEAVVGVYEDVLQKASETLGVTLAADDFAAIAVTQGPGLVGALVVGIAFAKGLAAAHEKPLIGVNHLEGHIYANRFVRPDLAVPFIASLVSGGHTMLVSVRNWGDYEVLGETIDDAVGEAFDKVAKALGLGYPGGPLISRLAAQGDPRAISFPRAMLRSGDFCFSLSGLKTSVITYINAQNERGLPIKVADVAASFTAAVVDVQVAKACAAVEKTGVREFCVGGGVAANVQLRAAYEKAFSERGVRMTVPPLTLCTDNADMIALIALYLYHRGVVCDYDMDADPHLSLSSGSTSIDRERACT